MGAAVSHDDPIVVSAVAAVSPVGHSAAVSFTSVKAGLARIGESTDLKIRDQKGKLMWVTCAAVTGITDGHRRYLRHYRMAVRAFAEVLAHARLDDALLDDTVLHLVLAEPERPGMDDRVEKELVRKISRVLELADLPSRTTITSTGHAGVFEAVQAAANAIATGQCARAIVGAVDGYLDELTLEWLNDTGRLKTDENAKGFVPGEAAAFLVFERLSSTVARKGRALARLAGIGNTVEPNSIYEKSACTGDGLTGAIRSALETEGDASSLSLVVCDLNGERYRANEWGLAMSRSFGTGSPPGLLWHPADCLGDCGAAAGVLNLVFGALALARRNVPDGRVLAWGSSDDGQRGAALLAAVSATRPH
jgi:3-oxoacyl-[acyl-carrier-protein] synthase-1